MSMLYKMSLAGVLIISVTSANAAIALDRTRVIYPGDMKSVSLTITNENKTLPYLAQAWLENGNGQRIDSPLSVTPPLQRVEPNKKSVIRLNDVAASALPQDRESVFWLNVREVPPKSDKPNTLQVALQTKIKVFYRPAAIIPDKFSHWENQLILHPAPDGYRVENPTPYYMTIAAITGTSTGPVDKAFRAMMLEPKSSKLVPSKPFATPYVTTINDFGGKPKTAFRCNGEVCKAVEADKSS